MFDPTHDDVNKVSLALKDWYHFNLDTFSANAVLAGQKWGSFLVRRFVMLNLNNVFVAGTIFTQLAIRSVSGERRWQHCTRHDQRHSWTYVFRV